MAKRMKKSRFQKLSRFVSKNFSVREFKKLAKGVVRDIVGESEAERMRSAGRIARKAGGPARVFSGSARPRSWSPLVKNMGAKILRLGPTVPPEIRAAAQDAVDGVGDYRNEKELREILAGAMGVEKSGAGWFNRRLTSLKTSFRNAVGAGVLFDQAQRGGLGGGLAQAGLLDMAVDKAEAVTHNKNLEKIATTLAKHIAGNPLIGTQILRAIGRGLRMGGAIGTAAQLGVSVGDEYLSQRGRSASAQLGAMNAAKALGVDAVTARNIRLRTRSANEYSLVGSAMDFLGFRAGTEEERATNQIKQYELIASAKKIAGRLGIDVAAVLQDAAAARGVAVEDLSAEDLKAVLNPLADRAAKSRVSAQSIKAELVKRGIVPNPNLSTDLDLGGGVIRIDEKRLQEITDIFLPQRRIDERNRMVEEEAKKIEVELASRIVKQITESAAKEEEAKAAARVEVPSRMIRSPHQGQGGEIFMIPNPDYDRWMAERRKTNEQIRDYGMRRDAYMRRRQVSWKD